MTAPPNGASPDGASPDGPSSAEAGDPSASRIPDNHPRAQSLRTRERLKDAVAAGLVHATGLIAHGRGEAFDYLLGERTPPEAHAAIAEAARLLAAARRPVLSLNGNVVALAAHQLEPLRAARPGLVLEVNVFHRTPGRVERLVRHLADLGVDDVLGTDPDDRIPGLSSDRALCCRDGIGGADVILVPLEDGDRCQALKAMGKTVITIDLNPLSRTAKAADVTIVDELTRALPLLTLALSGLHPGGVTEDGPPIAKSTDPIGAAYSNAETLAAVQRRMALLLSTTHQHA